MIDGLRAKDVRFVENLSDVPPGALTIFSAHGVFRPLKTRPVVGTCRTRCSLSTRFQGAQQGERYIEQGRTIILNGHEGHPEVDGTTGQLRGPVHLVQCIEDVDKLAIPDDTAVAYHSA